MMWISSCGGRLAATAARKATNSPLVWLGHGLAYHFASPRIQCGLERERAATDVLEAVAFGTPRRQGQHRQGTVERLDGRLFVETEYDCG